MRLQKAIQVACIVLCIIGTGHPCHAIGLDSLMNLPVVGVPVVNYSPETDWQFGVALQGYFRLPNQEKTSIVQLDGAYSLKNQWYINLSGNLYFGGQHPWLLYVRGGYRDFPDYYFDRGNEATFKAGTLYHSQRGYFTLQPMWEIAPGWSLGTRIDFLKEKTDVSAVDNVLMWGLGVVTQYDTRDIMYYPLSGIFFKAHATYYEPALGSSCRLGHVGADLRQYIPVRWSEERTMIIAWQFRTNWAFSANANDIPYAILPTLGGQDLIRGVRANMYKDNALLALQAEVRLPIWNFIHGVVFAGVGDVYNTKDWRWTTPKVGYGLGLRLGINKAKINIRLDAARNNIQRSWKTWDSYSFYITATEAF